LFSDDYFTYSLGIILLQKERYQTLLSVETILFFEAIYSDSIGNASNCKETTLPGLKQPIFLTVILPIMTQKNILSGIFNWMVSPFKF
jgi:hypothetical protein